MKKRAILVIFLAVQLVGICCLWSWQHAPSGLTMPMWGTALVLLFPGNILGSWLVERIFWQTRLSLLNMSILTTVLQFVINGALWFALVKLFKVVHALFSAHSDGSTSATPKPTRP
jgi:hypothetical protein